MSVLFSQGLMVGQAFAVLPMSSSSCRASATACGRALASAARKAMGSPVAFSAANFSLQADEIAVKSQEVMTFYMSDLSHC
jgi:hypothetical protein